MQKVEGRRREFFQNVLVIPAVPRKAFTQADCDPSIYTIYLSLCTQTADAISRDRKYNNYKLKKKEKNNVACVPEGLLLLEPDFLMTAGASGSWGEGVVLDAVVEQGGEGEGAPCWLEGDDRALTRNIALYHNKMF